MSELSNQPFEQEDAGVDFRIASRLTLKNGNELLLGHEFFGDFRLQVNSSDPDVEVTQLQAYHSVEPTILAHTIAQIIRSDPDRDIDEIVDDIFAREQATVVGELKYPDIDPDESMDRQYNKTFPLSRASASTDDLPRLNIGHEDRLQGYMYHEKDGVRITDQRLDENFEVVEREVAKIDNEDLPNFAAALIATARTDYGRVKHSDMVDTLRSALQLKKRIVSQSEREKFAMSIDDCVAYADKVIQQNGACLMLMDMVGSKHIFTSEKNRKDFLSLVANLNDFLDDYLPENELTAMGRQEKGFNIILGDGVTAGINDSQIIPVVAEYAETYYPHLPFRYGVAADGFDKPNIELIK